MSGYTKGAAAVLQALQRVEGDREAIMSNAALLAILDLSPVDSALAHALRLDSVWSRTMREQFRLAWSGNPDWRHLRATSMSGLSLSVLLERAEQARQEDGSDAIGERHLARVLAEMLRDNLRRDGIDAQRLVQEVEAMGLSPQTERIEQALEWEEFSFAKDRQAALAAAEDEREKLRSDLNLRNIFHSSIHIGGVIESHVRMMEHLVQARIDLRRDMARRVPELGSPARLAQLKQTVEDFIDATWSSLPSIIAGSYRGRESEPDFRQQVSAGQWAHTPLRLKSNAERELEMLKREVKLGMLEPKGQSIVFNITDSTVAALNLGTVMGNIQSVIVSLQESGDRDLAQGLKDLIEKVAEAEELGGERRDVIDSLAVIGEEAAKPQPERRTGVVRSLMRSVGAALGHVANVAQIWTALAPLIERHFGM